VHLNYALRYSEPQAGAALLARDGIVGLLKFLEQLGLIGSGDAGSSVTDRYIECAIIGFGLDGDFARISELDGVADEIDQDLRQAPSVTTAGWQFRSHLDLERKLLVGRQRLERAAHGLGDVLNGVIGEFQYELAGLDLGEIKHVIDQSEKMPPVGFKAFEYVAQHEREMIAQRTKDALQAARARGVVLGNPKLDDVRDRAVASVKADADRFAKNVAPIIREIQSSGATSHRGIARALNARGVATARGGAWTACASRRDPASCRVG
jgi:hypothetical protein